MKRLVLTAILSLIVIAGLMLPSCGDDECPACPEPDKAPEPYKGWVFTTMTWPVATVYKIDAETGEAVDSVLWDGQMEGGHIGASADGKYLAASHCCDWSDPQNPTGETRIYDPQSLAQIHTIPTIVDAVFPSNLDIMIGLGHDTLFIFELPSFEIVWADSFGLLKFPELYEPDHLMYASRWHDPTGVDSTDVFVFDYLNREAKPRIRVTSSRGIRVFLGAVAMHPDGQRLYFLGTDDPNIAMFGAVDVKTGDLLFEWRQMYTYLGDVVIRPDSKYAYVTDPEGEGMYADLSSGGILVFDLTTNTYYDGISMHGFGTYPGTQLLTRFTEVTPNGSHVFVSTGTMGRWSGSVLMIDAHDMRVEKVTWPELGYYPNELAIVPKQ